MRNLSIAFILIVGLIIYFIIMIYGGLELRYAKCFYLLPCAIFFANETYNHCCSEAVRFIPFSCLTAFFLAALLNNLLMLSNPYETIMTFLGLNIVILIIRYK